MEQKEKNLKAEIDELELTLTQRISETCKGA
jgi:hypothetical protein